MRVSVETSLRGVFDLPNVSKAIRVDKFNKIKGINKGIYLN